MTLAEVVSSSLSDFYSYFVSDLPGWMSNFIGLFLLVIVVVIYSIFIWKFHKFISKKNVFSLDLHQYNKSEHPFLSKLGAMGLYVVEYIIVLPLLIFFWFGVFSLFLILLTKDIPMQTILILSATIIGAIRMVSYYSENASREVAKLFPFTLLAVAMTESGFFNFERIITQISQLPQFFNHILIYLFFIIVIETVLRLFEFLFGIFGLTEENTENN
jgi:MFS family permease